MYSIIVSSSKWYSEYIRGDIYKIWMVVFLDNNVNKTRMVLSIYPKHKLPYISLMSDDDIMIFFSLISYRSLRSQYNPNKDDLSIWRFP